MKKPYDLYTRPRKDGKKIFYSTGLTPWVQNSADRERHGRITKPRFIDRQVHPTLCSGSISSSASFSDLSVS